MANTTEGDEDFSAVISSFRQMITDPEIAHAVAAIKALTQVTKSSKAATIMGLEKELKTAADVLKEAIKNAPFSLSSGCELFTRFVTKTSLDIPDFETCKKKLIDRGDQFAQKSQASRAKIAQLADRFIRDGAVVLTHGFSRVVQALLLHAASQGKQFRVFVTEARPGDPIPNGYMTAERLRQAQIPGEFRAR
jgi:translation initiation factor eIF-2B subunit alpha